MKIGFVFIQISLLIESVILLRFQKQINSASAADTVIWIQYRCRRSSAAIAYPLLSSVIQNPSVSLSQPCIPLDNGSRLVRLFYSMLNIAVNKNYPLIVSALLNLGSKLLTYWNTQAARDFECFLGMRNTSATKSIRKRGKPNLAFAVSFVCAEKVFLFVIIFFGGKERQKPELT